MDLACHQMKVKRMTLTIAKNMNFAAQTASAPAKRMIVRLVGIPFFPPPAAHRAARTTVPSIHHNCSSMASVLRRRSSIRPSVPSSFHLSKRSHAVLQGPNSSGRSRHGEPVWSIHKIPSITVLRSRGGRPVRLGSGNRSEINNHCSSVSRCRSIMTPFTYDYATLIGSRKAF